MGGSVLRKVSDNLAEETDAEVLQQLIALADTMAFLWAFRMRELARVRLLLEDVQRTGVDAEGAKDKLMDVEVSLEALLGAEESGGAVEEEGE